MNRRSTLVTAVFIGLGLLVAMAGCGSSASTGATAHDGLSSLRGIGQRLDSPLPKTVGAAHLVDSRGNPHTINSLKGKIVVLDDTMTLCRETCPLDTAALVQAARKADQAGLSDKVVFVSLTVDPDRDTPEQLAAYRKQFSPAPKNWMLLTGQPAAVHGVLKSLGIYWEKVTDGDEVVHNWRTGKLLTYDVEHSDELFFIDETGKERFLLDGPPQLGAGGKIPGKLKSFLSDEGRKNVADPDPSDWSVPQALKVLGVLTHKKLT